MANKLDVISYFIGKMNDASTGIDLTDILKPDGTQKYLDNPFIPVIFKQNDNGSISTLIDTTVPLQIQLPEQKLIYVNFTDSELEKENIYKADTDTNPIDSWVGGVGISMFIEAENVEEYQTIYQRISDWHDQYLINIVETANLFGANRSVELVSSNIVDNEGKVLLNRLDYKQISFAVTMNVTNPNMLRASRRRIQYQKADDTWEEINALDKSFTYTKSFIDDTNVGEVITKSEPDVSTRTIAFNVLYDSSSELVNDIITEVETDRETGTNNNTFTFRLIRQLPDNTETTFDMEMSLASMGESNSSNFSVLALTFREV